MSNPLILADLRDNCVYGPCGRFGALIAATGRFQMVTNAQDTEKCFRNHIHIPAATDEDDGLLLTEGSGEPHYDGETWKPGYRLLPNENPFKNRLFINPGQTLSGTKVGQPNTWQHSGVLECTFEFSAPAKYDRDQYVLAWFSNEVGHIMAEAERIAGMGNCEIFTGESYFNMIGWNLDEGPWEYAQEAIPMPEEYTGPKPRRVFGVFTIQWM